MAHQYVTSRNFGDDVLNIYGTPDAPVFIGNELGAILKQNILPLAKNCENDEWELGSVERDGIVSTNILLHVSAVLWILKHIDNQPLSDWFEETCRDLKNGVMFVPDEPDLMSAMNLKLLSTMSMDRLSACERLFGHFADMKKTSALVRAREIERDMAAIELEKMRLGMATLPVAPAPLALPAPAKKDTPNNNDLAMAWIMLNSPEGVNGDQYFERYMQENPTGIKAKQSFGRCVTRSGFKRGGKKLEYWTKA